MRDYIKVINGKRKASEQIFNMFELFFRMAEKTFPEELLYQSVVELNRCRRYSTSSASESRISFACYYVQPNLGFIFFQARQCPDSKPYRYYLLLEIEQEDLDRIISQFEEINGYLERYSWKPWKKSKYKKLKKDHK